MILWREWSRSMLVRLHRPDWPPSRHARSRSRRLLQDVTGNSARSKMERRIARVLSAIGYVASRASSDGVFKFLRDQYGKDRHRVRWRDLCPPIGIDRCRQEYLFFQWVIAHCDVVRMRPGRPKSLPFNRRRRLARDVVNNARNPTQLIDNTS